jgi:hypothetical protein
MGTTKSEKKRISNADSSCSPIQGALIVASLLNRLTASAVTGLTLTAAVVAAPAAYAALDPASLIVSPGCVVAGVLEDPALARVSLTFADGSSEAFVHPERLRSWLYAGTGPRAGAVITAVTATTADGATATVAGRADCAAHVTKAGPVTTASDGITVTWKEQSAQVTSAVPMRSLLVERASGRSTFRDFTASPQSTDTVTTPDWPLAVRVTTVDGNTTRLVTPLAAGNPGLPPDSVASTGLRFAVDCTTLRLVSSPEPISSIQARWVDATSATSTATLTLDPPGTSSGPLNAPAGMALDAFGWTWADGRQQPVSRAGMDCSAVLGGSAPGAPASSPPAVPAPTPPAPVEPSPVGPAPVEPSPETPAPVEPSPESPTPVEPAPETPAPVEPAPAGPLPVEPAPTPPAPVEPAPTQTASSALLVSTPVTGTGVREDGQITYGVYAANTGATPLSVTLSLPTPRGTVLEDAQVRVVGSSPQDVRVTPDGVSVTVTVPPSTQALLSVGARVTAPVGSTVRATGQVNGQATNTASHSVVGIDAPGCPAEGPAVCVDATTVGLPVPTVCWSATTVVSTTPGVPDKTVREDNDSLSTGVTATGCGSDIRQAPDATDLLQARLYEVQQAGEIRLVRRDGLADGRYAVAVEHHLRMCVLGDSGVVVACSAPWLSESSMAERTLTSDQRPPVVEPPVVAPPVALPPLVEPPSSAPPAVPPTVVQAGGGAAAASQSVWAVIAGVLVAVVVAAGLSGCGRRREDAAE